MGGLAFLGGVARLGTSLVLTLLGLLLVTFLIGRVVPIDPVLAAVGDRAPPDVYERVKEELGLNLPLFYATLGWVAGPGRLDVAYDDLVDPVTGVLTIDALLAGEPDVFWNALSHLVLPASLLGYFSLAYIARMTRSFMLNELRQE